MPKSPLPPMNAAHRRRNQGALGALAPTKFVSAHRNLVFHNRNVSCWLIVPPQL